MTIGKFFVLATVFVAAFTLGSCSRDDDEEEKTVVENNPKSVEHEYVDLGLPSGTLWATCNVGASKPEEYGDYFAWGEVKAKDKFDESTYKWYNGSYKAITKYCTDSEYGTVDNKTELLPEDDVATAHWGSSWCIPSSKQFTELIDPAYTTTAWTTQNGVNGLKITSKKNAKTLFLPAAGERYPGQKTTYGSMGESCLYWSSSLHTDRTCWAYALFASDGYLELYDGARLSGFAVRPVRTQK